MSGSRRLVSQRNALPVIAVGGGLAGAAFALDLARNGRRVIVLERTRGPHHKVCGEFVSEEGQGVLSSFGLDVGALGASSSIFGDLLAGARPLLPKPVAIAAIAYGFLRSKPVAPNVFPVGDQFAIVPSFAGAVGWLLETPVTCAISIAAARLFPGLVACVAAATRSKALAQVPQRPCRGPE